MNLLPWSSPQDFAARAVAFDTETHAAGDDDKACKCPRCAALPVPDQIPRLVCGSVCDRRPGTERLLGRKQTCETFVRLIRDPRAIIVGTNLGGFDFPVMVRAVREELNIDIIPDVFAKLDAGHVYDISIAEEENAIANGVLGKDPWTGAPRPKSWYNLEIVTSDVLGRDNAKENDEYRLLFGHYEGRLNELPEVARRYVLDDVRNPLDVSLAQVGAIPKRVLPEWGTDRTCKHCGVAAGGHPGLTCFAVRPHRNLHDMPAQVATAFALELSSKWGLPVDAKATARLRAFVDDIRKDVAPYVAVGLLRPNRDGSHTKDTGTLKRLVCEAYGVTRPCPLCTGARKILGPDVTKAGKKKKPSLINCTECDGAGLDGAGLKPTATGGICTDRDVLNESGNEMLMSWAHRESVTAKLDNTYLPLLEGAARTGGRVHPRVRKIIVDTGRTSYGDGIDGLPRKGGIRECFAVEGADVPGSSDWVINSSDYEGGELITHAQSCLWLCEESALADALIAGVKPHNKLGAQMIGATYADYTARYNAGDRPAVDARQAAKKANFGFPGGLGAPMFTLRQREDKDVQTECPAGPVDLGGGKRGYRGLRSCVLLDGASECGTVMMREYPVGRGDSKRFVPCSPMCRACVEANQRLRQDWFTTWPENRKYFKTVNRFVDEGMPVPPALADLIGVLSPGQVLQHRSHRIRGGLIFTELANGFFQGLLADATKAAVRAIARECFVRTRVTTRPGRGVKPSAYEGVASPLYGSRLMKSAHDETITLHPRSVMHDAATRQGEIMVEWLSRYCPDLAPAVKCDPALMVRLSKSAEPVRNKEGRLLVWDEVQDGTTKASQKASA